MVIREEPAVARVVHSRVTTYRAVILDVRWSQAIHSCDVCNLHQLYEADNATKQLNNGGNASKSGGQYCSAIHYGMCSAVKFTPVQQATAKHRQQGGQVQVQTNGPRGGAGGGSRAVRIVTKVVTPLKIVY